MSTLRPLPARPSLEYARKEAKALLRQLRTGDAESLTRVAAQSSHLEASDPTRVRLADAQLVVAREHGFASWPRLARYLGDVERQQRAHVQLHGGPSLYEAHVRELLAAHNARSTSMVRTLAAYVPRFYGKPLADVVASTVTEDEARLAVARMHGAPSWDVLLERLADNARTQPADWAVDPMRHAIDAMKAADVSALQRVAAAHPELLRPSQYDLSAGRTLMSMALGQERGLGADAMQPIMSFLAAQGFDRRRELGERLCGHMGMTADEVRMLLDAGADPNWVAPNGVSVLEHALLRYWNGAAVDVLAARATPRHALWIAAGLGDVDGVRGFLDAHGKPTTAARRDRPDFLAAGASHVLVPLPDADGDEILVETMVIAALNGRTAVIDYMASRGAPLDSLVFDVPLIIVAVGNAMTAMVECLVRCGADLDLRGARPSRSAREMAREMFEQFPENIERRHIVEICGMDPDVVLVDLRARQAAPPELAPEVRRALAFAGEDATRLEQPDVRPENLLIGLLRVGGPPLYFLKEMGRMDVERFRVDYAERIGPTVDDAKRTERPNHAKLQSHAELPMRADAQDAVDAAIAFVAARRRGEVEGLHLLHALTRHDDSEVDELLARYAVNATALRAVLEKSV